MKKTVASCALAALLALSACSGNAAENQATEAVVADESAASTSEAVQMVSVDVDAGTLIGLNDNGMYSFRGVPYATAERFKDPVPVTEYENGAKLALSYGEVSPQDRGLDGTGRVNEYEFMTPTNGTADMVMNENCQNLNVWTSDLSGSKPVVVFFHGGGLFNGAASELSYYTGEYFAAREDAVFVSVNHRLNVLGYLDLSDYGDEYANSGLAGQRDQVEALRWVQKNIAQFGGDPSNVTIVGQSGGGQKVTTLACMSDTADLFSKVFVMSGGISSPDDNADWAKENTKKLVDSLGLKDDEVIDTLTSMSYEELYQAFTDAGCSANACYGISTFESPLFDAEGKMNEYAKARTWIMGTTFSEFAASGTQLIYGGFSLGGDANKVGNPDASLDKTDDEALAMLTELYGDKAQDIAEAFKAAYPEKALVEALYLNPMPVGGLSRAAFINQYGDLFNANGATVYNYVAAYNAPYFGGTTMHHTADIPYWFGSIDTIEYQIKGDEDNAHAISNLMADSLAAFLSTGNPSTADVSWEPYTSDNHATMVFSDGAYLRVDFDHDLYDLILSE